MIMRLLPATVLLMACSQEESGDLFTRGIHPAMSAVATGDGTTSVSTTLYEDRFEYVELTDGDRLVAWQDSTSRVMRESEFLNIVSYGATFDIDDEDAEFRVAFEREVDESAPDSHAALPAPFELDAPRSASRKGELVIAWTNEGRPDPMSWDLQGECVEPASGDLPDDEGTLTLAPDTIRQRAEMGGTPVPDECTVTLHVRRRRTGTVDPAFEEGGSFAAEQSRSAMFTSTP